MGEELRPIHVRENDAMMLSRCRSRATLHWLIHVDEKRQVYVYEGDRFPTLYELVRHYSLFPLDGVLLGNPVPLVRWYPLDKCDGRPAGHMATTSTMLGALRKCVFECIDQVFYIILNNQVEKG